MGVLGELFPGQKILDESSEAAAGEKWRLGPIDLDNDTVVLHRAAPKPVEDEDNEQGQEQPED